MGEVGKMSEAVAKAWRVAGVFAILVGGGLLLESGAVRLGGLLAFGGAMALGWGLVAGRGTAAELSLNARAAGESEGGS